MKKPKLFQKKKDSEPFVEIKLPEEAGVSYLLLKIRKSDKSASLSLIHGEQVTFDVISGALQSVRDQVIYDIAVSHVKNEKAAQPENNQPAQ